MTDTVATPKAQMGTTAPGLSPGDLLKQAVSGPVKAVAEPGLDKTVSPLKLRLTSLVDARGIVGAAGLALGLVIGAGGVALMVPRGDSGAALMAKIEADLEVGRSETARLASEVKRLAGAVAASGERAAEEAKGVRADLTQRIARAEQALSTRMAAFAERHDAADKDQAARLAALSASIEKRMSQSAPQAAPAPQAAKPVAAEPAETGAIAEAKPTADAKLKPASVPNWAVRDVYDGIAVLEDRKRRLVEVARGDIVPGVGRVDAIERRGRTWVVVTREGLITPQEW